MTVSATTLRTAVWALTLVVLVLPILAWLPRASQLTLYTLFPLFGLLAYSLMWAHYVAGALRRYLGFDDTVLHLHFYLTSWLVLGLILLHPFLFELGLYLDGLGLPPANLFSVYPGVLERLGILAAVVALVCFLFYEFHRIYKAKSWWRYVETANEVAMGFIIFHGFTLGGEIRNGWYYSVWVVMAVTLGLCVAYSRYHKRRT